MLNIYKTLKLTKNSNLIEACNNYQKLCTINPLNTFLLTKALAIISNKFKRIFYDANFYQISIPILFYNHKIYDQFYDIEEYNLISFIEWLEIYKNAFYDTKYFLNNPIYHKLIENWYNNIEEILENLKSYTKNFYLS